MKINLYPCHDKKDVMFNSKIFYLSNFKKKYNLYLHLNIRIRSYFGISENTEIVFLIFQIIKIKIHEPIKNFQIKNFNGRVSPILDVQPITKVIGLGIFCETQNKENIVRTEFGRLRIQHATTKYPFSRISKVRNSSWCDSRPNFCSGKQVNDYQTIFKQSLKSY